jgi:hypothetical protein
MSSTTATAAPSTRPESTANENRRAIPRAGWMVIAGKEFGDHLLSSRFYVLAIIMALAAAVPLYFLGNAIRDAAERAGEQPALFAALFAASPPVNDQISLPCRASSRWSGHCSAWRSPSTRSTASERTARCPASSLSRSTATT